MLSGNGNKKGQKKSVGLISTKTTLHMQHTFIVHFIAIILHNYNAKLPDTSLLHVLPGKSFLCSCSLFSLLLIFTLVFASISHFLTAAKKFSCFSFNKIGLLCFLSLTLDLSLLSSSMQTLKLSRKKELVLLLLFFISKSPGGYMQYLMTKCKGT